MTEINRIPANRCHHILELYNAGIGMINQYSGDTPTLRLLCSITGRCTGTSVLQYWRCLVLHTVVVWVLNKMVSHQELRIDTMYLLLIFIVKYGLFRVANKSLEEIESEIRLRKTRSYIVLQPFMRNHIIK